MISLQFTKLDLIKKIKELCEYASDKSSGETKLSYEMVYFEENDSLIDSFIKSAYLEVITVLTRYYASGHCSSSEISFLVDTPPLFDDLLQDQVSSLVNELMALRCASNWLNVCGRPDYSKIYSTQVIEKAAELSSILSIRKKPNRITS